MNEHCNEIDRVPRTASEESLLLQTRPPGWEYLYFGAVLLRRRNERERKWQEHEARVRRPALGTLSEAEAPDHIANASKEMGQAIFKLDRLMTPRSQRRAFGTPGMAGNQARIAAFAEGIVDCYSELLEASEQLRAEDIPAKYRKLADICSETPNAPLRQIRDFIDYQVEKLDGPSPCPARGAFVHLGGDHQRRNR